MSDFFAALGLAIVLEGIAYAAFPDQMKRALSRMLDMPNSTLRTFALTIAAVGLIILWMARGSGIGGL